MEFLFDIYFKFQKGEKMGNWEFRVIDKNFLV